MKKRESVQITTVPKMTFDAVADAVSKLQIKIDQWLGMPATELQIVSLLNADEESGPSMEGLLIYRSPTGVELFTLRIGASGSGGSHLYCSNKARVGGVGYSLQIPHIVIGVGTLEEVDDD